MKPFLVYDTKLRIYIYDVIYDLFTCLHESGIINYLFFILPLLGAWDLEE